MNASHRTMRAREVVALIEAGRYSDVADELDDDVRLADAVLDLQWGGRDRRRRQQRKEGR